MEVRACRLCYIYMVFTCEDHGPVVAVVSCFQMSSLGLLSSEVGRPPPPCWCFLFSPCSQSLPDFLWAPSPPLKSDLFRFSKAITFVAASKDLPG